MPSIRIYDPALCCATGVCGTDVDPELVRMSADIDWLTDQGADVQRFNMASEPTAFATDETVRNFLAVSGSEGLPLVLVDGVTVAAGKYPSRDQLAKWAGLAEAPLEQTPAEEPVEEPAEGCCGNGCCG